MCKMQVQTKLYHKSVEKIKQLYDAKSYFRLMLNALKVM